MSNYPTIVIEGYTLIWIEDLKKWAYVVDDTCKLFDMKDRTADEFAIKNMIREILFYEMSEEIFGVIYNKYIKGNNVFVEEIQKNGLNYE